MQIRHGLRYLYHQRGLKRLLGVKGGLRLVRSLTTVLYPLLPRTRSVCARLNPGRVFKRWGERWLATLDLARQLTPKSLPARLNVGAIPRIVTMIVVSDIRVDPRVYKAAQTAAKRGFQVRIIIPCFHGTREPPTPVPDWGPSIVFDFLQASHHALLNHFYPWLIDSNVKKQLLASGEGVIHAHDLNTCVMALAAGRELGLPVICDFHEWFSENVQWSTRAKAYVRNTWFKRTVMRRAEALCMQQADAVVTVCDSIANELLKLQPRRDGVHVVRNIPSFDQGVAVTGVPLRQACGVDDATFLLLWQGGIGPSRLLEPVIAALAYLPGVVFAIRGPGLEDGSPYWNHYEQVAANEGVSAQLRLLPPVPSAQVVAAAHGANAGIWTLPNLSKNFYFALPNKIFEYLTSGLPVVGANFPEVKRLIDKYEVGFTFDPYDSKSIAQVVAKLRDNPAISARCAANTRVALRDMNADTEWNKLGDLYDSIFQQRRGGGVE